MISGKSKMIGGSVLALGLAAVFVMAGPIDPPAGPVAPSGPTLADVSDAVALVGQDINGIENLLASSFPNLMYWYEEGTIPSNLNGTTIHTGTGILRKVIVTPDPGVTTFWLQFGDGSPNSNPIVNLVRNGTSDDETVVFDLDIPFSSSLQVRSQPSSTSALRVTVVYELPPSTLVSRSK